MTLETRVASPPVAGSDSSPAAAVYAEGLLAGVVGATTIAAWFLILDSLRGQPFLTPTVLGTALFRGGAGLESPATLPVDFEMVLSFTWVHVLAFLLVGVAGARLLALAERDPNFGFGIVLLFVVFEFGFVIAGMFFAEDVLASLSWPAILVGNLLAAAAMAVYFRRHHPNLLINP